LTAFAPGTADDAGGGHVPAARVRLLMLLAFAAIWFAGLGQRTLVKPDEGRYAEIPREMAVSGDWVTPRLNGIKYFEKPPMQYWATAAAYRAFGASPGTARLWTAATGFAGVLLVYAAGCALFGRAAGWLGALVLGSNLYYFLLGHINTLDMGLAFFCCAGLCALLLAQRPDTATGSRRRWMALAWLAVAGGVLSKGLIALVLPGLATAVYMLVQRDLRLLGRMHPIMGGLLVVAVCAPWFLAVSHANPEFARFFFVHEHFERFATTVHRRVQPFWVFVPLAIVGMLPWAAAAGVGLVRAWRPAPDFHAQRYLLIWCAVVIGFFSASQSKLPAYILPMFPALALLSGIALARLPAAFHARTIELPATLLAVLFAAGAWFVGRSGEPAVRPLYEQFSLWLWAAAATMAVGVLAFRHWRLHDATAAAWCALALASATAGQIGLLGYDALAPVQSAASLVDRVRDRIVADAPFYSVGTYDQTLDFYLGRTVTVVAFQDELEFGLRQQPELWLPSVETFRQAWLAAPRAYAIMEPETFAALTASRLPMTEIARDSRRVIVARP